MKKKLMMRNKSTDGTDETDYSHVALAIVPRGHGQCFLFNLLINCIINKNYEKDLCLCRAVARLDAAHGQECEKGIALEYE